MVSLIEKPIIVSTAAINESFNGIWKMINTSNDKRVVEQSYDSHEACRKSANFSKAVSNVNENQAKGKEYCEQAIFEETSSG